MSSREEQRHSTNSSADSGSDWTLSGAGSRAELLHVLLQPDPERAERSGEFWSYLKTRTFAEL